MPETISANVQSPPAQRRPLRLTLNSDGQRHPLLNAVAGFTVLAGVASFALGLIVRLHLPATILGMAAFGIGLIGEYVGRTYEQVRGRPRYLIAAVLAPGAEPDPERLRVLETTRV